MITYKIDKQSQSAAATQIRDMSAVLAEIAPTLRVLQDLLTQHEAAISTPSINSFRYDLQRAVDGAIENTRAISDNAQKLASVSDQASKHLSAIEEHFGSALREKSAAAPRPAQVA